MQECISIINGQLNVKTIPLSEVIADFEKDPGMAEKLREARKAIAPILFPEKTGETYERLMRGEAPPRTNN